MEQRSDGGARGGPGRQRPRTSLVPGLLAIAAGVVFLLFVTVLPLVLTVWSPSDELPYELAWVFLFDLFDPAISTVLLVGAAVATAAMALLLLLRRPGPFAGLAAVAAFVLAIAARLWWWHDLGSRNGLTEDVDLGYVVALLSGVVMIVAAFLGGMARRPSGSAPGGQHGLHAPTGSWSGQLPREAHQPQPPPVTTPAAGWHPDPTGQHESRYWDGSQWTEHVAGQGPQPPPVAAPPPEPPPAPAAAPPAAAADGIADDAAGNRGGEEPAEQLRRLRELRDEGLITPEDFEAKKAEILGRL